MSGVAGDFNKLGLLIANLGKLSQVPDAAAPEAATAITAELQAEFKGGKDPYGKAWAALKPSTLATGRKPPPLTGWTTKLRDGTLARAVRGVGIQLLAGAAYGAFHQSGTKNMAARPIFPYGGLPKAWNAAIAQAVRNAVRKILAA